MVVVGGGGSIDAPWQEISGARGLARAGFGMNHSPGRLVASGHRDGLRRTWAPSSPA